jgi:hypothetical protein
LVGRYINEYLKAAPSSYAIALEQLRKAIHHEEEAKRDGEDWSVAKDYVRSLWQRMM